MVSAVQRAGGQEGSPGGMAGWGMCHTDQGIKQKLLLSCT